jgi:16S rRNA (uracil1498-N3)-methyltransferase
MHFFYSQNIDKQIITLLEEETSHAKNVLRLRPTDKVNVLDGKGTVYHCMIQEFKKKETVLEIFESKHFSSVPYHFHLAIAPTKSADRIEWMLEKLVEIGIQEISFIKTKHSERKQINIERLHKIAVAAMKQSHNYYLPKINNIMEFKELLSNSVNCDYKYIAHLGETSHSVYFPNAIKTTPIHSKIIFLVGPEGDFTHDEVKSAKNFVPVSLGTHTLRTETAGIFASTAININFTS